MSNASSAMEFTCNCKISFDEASLEQILDLNAAISTLTEQLKQLEKPVLHTTPSTIPATSDQFSLMDCNELHDACCALGGCHAYKYTHNTRHEDCPLYALSGAAPCNSWVKAYTAEHPEFMEVMRDYLKAESEEPAATTNAEQSDKFDAMTVTELADDCCNRGLCSACNSERRYHDCPLQGINADGCPLSTIADYAEEHPEIVQTMRDYLREEQRLADSEKACEYDDD